MVLQLTTDELEFVLMVALKDTEKTKWAMQHIAGYYVTKLQDKQKKYGNWQMQKEPQFEPLQLQHEIDQICNEFNL